MYIKEKQKGEGKEGEGQKLTGVSNVIILLCTVEDVLKKKQNEKPKHAKRSIKGLLETATIVL